MRGLLTVLAATSALACLTAQTKAPGFDGGRAYEHIRRLVALGPRPAGSAAIAESRKYLAGELQRIGLKAEEQPFDVVTPIGPRSMVNVIARIRGARPERIILAGHYDTKLYREFSFVGANDGGSSAAFLLEMARVLKDRQNPLTIELLWLDGEEATLPDWGGTDHTYGSQHYVEAAAKNKSLASIKALILVDMIGDRQLAMKRELHSTRWLTDALWSSAKQLGFDQHFLSVGSEIEDDHVPFLKAGVQAVDLIDLDYPAWHTAQDTLDQVSARSLEVVGQV
ncbi:MAG: M28 family peptidase, partial [Acidobacteria bacterium]|nr:M28 family peptidase [Acidobacteriota bacterium]